MKNKILIIVFLCLFVMSSLAGAMTYTIKSRPNSNWWSGSQRDNAWRWAKEVEDILDEGVYFVPSTQPTSSEGRVYYDSASKALKLYNGSAWVALEAGGEGTSLDLSYDLGYEITVDGSAVTLTIPNNANNAGLVIANNDSTNDPYALEIVQAAGNTGTAVLINSVAGGTDIAGDNWSVNQAGKLTCVGIDTTGTLIMESDDIISNAVNDTFTFTTGDEDLTLDFTTGSNLLTLSSTTGLTTIDFAALTSIVGLTTITGDAAAFTLGITADATGEDLTISQAGSVDASVVLSSAGTAADAILLTSSAGGVTVTASGSASGDFIVTAVDDISMTATDDLTLNGGSGGSIISIGTNTHGNVINIGTNDTTADTISIGSAKDTTTVTGVGVTIVSGTGDITLDSGDDIFLAADTGTGDVISIINTQGTAAGATILRSVAGGVDIDAAATLDVDIAGGQVLISSKDNASSAIALTTNVGTSETIVITNTAGTGTGAITLTGTAGGISIAGKDDVALTVNSTTTADDLTINQVGAVNASILLNAAGTGADAIGLNATGAGGGIALATTNGGITLNAANATAGDITLTAADDLILAITGVVTGNIYGDGTDFFMGYLRAVEVESGTSEDVLVTDSGKVFVNTAANGATTYSLPDAAAGLIYTFVDNSATGGDDVIIVPKAGDNIDHDTNGDGVQNVSDEASASITLIAINGTDWITMCKVGTWGQQ